MAKIKEGYEPDRQPRSPKDLYPYVPEGWLGQCSNCKRWVEAEKNEENVSDSPARYSSLTEYPVPEAQRHLLYEEEEKRKKESWLVYQIRCPKCGKAVVAGKPEGYEFSETNPNWG